MLSSFQGRFAFGKSAPSGPPPLSPPSNPRILLAPPDGSNLDTGSGVSFYPGTYPAADEPVYAWLDDGPNGWEAFTQNYSNRAPQYKTGVMTVNGSPVDAVYFGSNINPPYTACMDFANQYYDSRPANGLIGFTPGPASMCFDFQLTELPGAGTEFMLVSRLAGGSFEYYTELYCSNYAGYTSLCWKFVAAYGVSAAAVGYAATLDTNRHRLIITYDGVDNTAPSSYTARLDGSPVTPVSTGNFNPSSIYSSIGADAASNYGNFRGYIRSIAAYDRVLTTQECEDWEAWVGAN